MIDKFEIEVERPKWAKWLARDENSAICYYENRPLIGESYWKPDGGRWGFAIDAYKNSCLNWRESLVELKPKTMIKIPSETPPKLVRYADFEAL